MDCIIACGPFPRDEDIWRQYLQGGNHQIQWKPHERSRQETAALEGIMSSTLSQLESIGCRVVYGPHPIQLILPLPFLPLAKEGNSRQHAHLTSNSVNVHEQWLPLAPGMHWMLWFRWHYCATTRETLWAVSNVCSSWVLNLFRACVFDCRGTMECWFLLSLLPSPHSLTRLALALCSPEYQEALTRILDLAPPSSTTVPKSDESTSSSSESGIVFASRRQQAILVTHVGMANKNDHTTTTKPDDVLEWPRDHFSFLDSCQSKVFLNIAAAPCPPFQQPVGKETVLVSPGSLRESGDYWCLIDVGIHNTITACNPNNKEQDQTFTWKVDRLQFWNMNSVKNNE